MPSYGQSRRYSDCQGGTWLSVGLGTKIDTAGVATIRITSRDRLSGLTAGCALNKVTTDASQKSIRIAKRKARELVATATRVPSKVKRVAVSGKTINPAIK